MGRLRDMIPCWRVARPGRWFRRYAAEWVSDHPGVAFDSGWARGDVNGSWVWVWMTSTPEWDRDWFDANRIRFPRFWFPFEEIRGRYLSADHISWVVRV